MNEQLRFSWGHIVAFIALIAVGYFSFMGFTYLTDGNLMFAAIGAVISILLYVLVFIGAQVMKGSGNKISKKIIWERILIFGSPLVLVAVMVSISHFWTIKSQNDEIVHTFTDALNNSRQLFADYENYSDQRIKNYSNQLDSVVANKSLFSQQYASAGFKDGMEQMQKENMVQALKLVLINDNYQELKDKALNWIGKANEGTSTWNIFLLGNKREIKEAVLNWEKELKELSSRHLSNEGQFMPVEEFSSNGAQLSAEGIDGLTESFTTYKFPTVMAIFFGIVIYLMLLLPYFIQQRHGRQVAMNYSLLKNGKDTGLTVDSEDVRGMPRHTVDNIATSRPEHTYQEKAFAAGNKADAGQSSPVETPLNQSAPKKKSFKRITLD